VGILTKYDLQIEIVSEKRSEDENFLLQHIRLSGTELIIGSIYGPNHLDLEFFAALEDALSNYDTGNIQVILGGDFNCTYSCDPVPENIDCLNMARPPNISHSKKIPDICDRFNLTDPYRYFNPDLQEFTYTPRSETLKNKSRIDFFLVSEMLMGAVDNCKISQNVQNKLFDHKAINLSINEKIKPGIVRPTISNKDLNDDLLEFVVKTTVSETYLQHCTDNSLYGVNKNFLLNTCGTIRRLIRECGPPIELRVGDSGDPEASVQRERIRNRLQVLSGTLNLNRIEQANLSCDPGTFMEIMLLNLKNDTVSHQSFIRKTKKNKLSVLKKQLSQLSHDTVANADAIKTTEGNLNILIDTEMRAELESYRHYDILHNEQMTPRFLSLSKI
jgi:hypothetical protein